MKIYADETVLRVKCPSCGADKNVWCAPWKACERRVILAEDKT